MDKALRLVGLARRGGNTAVGDEAAACSVRSGRAKSILIASDASDRTVRRAQSLAAEGRVEVLTISYTKEELGASVGRLKCAVLCITDAGIAAAVKAALSDTAKEHNKITTHRR